MKLRKPEDAGKRPPYETSPGDGKGPRPSIGGGAANERGDAAQPLRKLARLCEHDRMEQHQTDTGDLSKPFSFTVCPGGVFLPDDTLIIEKVDGEWPEWAIEVLYNVRVFFPNAPTALLDALFDGETPEVEKNQMGMW